MIFRWYVLIKMRLCHIIWQEFVCFGIAAWFEAGYSSFFYHEKKDLPWLCIKCSRQMFPRQLNAHETTFHSCIMFISQCKHIHRMSTVCKSCAFQQKGLDSESSLKNV